jgi:hypothetical protein
MTAQVREVLILNGKRVSMAFCPPLPECDPRVVENDYDELDDRDKDCLSTACWREYQGTWEIAQGRLFLTGLRGRYRLLGDDPLFADWFSGVIRVPQGRLLHYIHMGFGSVFARELHIRIECGNIVRSRTRHNCFRRLDFKEIYRRSFPGSENRFDGDQDV